MIRWPFTHNHKPAHSAQTCTWERNRSTDSLHSIAIGRKAMPCQVIENLGNRRFERKSLPLERGQGASRWTVEATGTSNVQHRNRVHTRVRLAAKHFAAFRFQLCAYFTRISGFESDPFSGSGKVFEKNGLVATSTGSHSHGGRRDEVIFEHGGRARAAESRPNSARRQRGHPRRGGRVPPRPNVAFFVIVDAELPLLRCRSQPGKGDRHSYPPQ